MVERLIAEVPDVMALVEEEARILKHNYVGTEHLLLGLLRIQEGVAARVLSRFDVTIEHVRAQIVRIVGVGDEATSGKLPLTPRTRKVLDLSRLEAEVLGDPEIGTEHILLALARENEGVAARILLEFDARSERIIDTTLQLIEAERVHSGGSEVSKGPDDPDASDGRPSEVLADVPFIEGVPTHRDLPSAVDELGRLGLAEVLADRIRRAGGEESSHGPRSAALNVRGGERQDGAFMVHVHAPWGAGKSSLLRLLRDQLQSPRGPGMPSWIVVEFSAWQHQRLRPPWWWLLTSVRSSALAQLRAVSGRRWVGFWCKDFIWRLWNSRVALASVFLVIVLAAVAWCTGLFGLAGTNPGTLKTVLASASGIVVLGGALAAIVAGVSRWLVVGSADATDKLLSRAPDPLEVFKRRFGYLVRAVKAPVAVFIDDLDRCDAGYVVELLEGIQTLFAEQGVTYVIAADREWLRESYARVYSEFAQAVGEPGRPLGYLFLEKTFQLSIEVPVMSREVRRTYWKRLLTSESAETQDASGQQRAREAAEREFADLDTEGEIYAQLMQNSDSEATDIDRRRAAARRLGSPELVSQLQHRLQEFADLIENNPRAMKRLINSYGVERARRVRDGEPFDEAERKRSILWTIVKLRWPSLADHLARSPHDAAVWCRGSARPEGPLAEMIAPLAEDETIQAVFDGGSVGVALDEATVRAYVGAEERAAASSVGV
jgi:hypothetical protein